MINPEGFASTIAFTAATAAVDDFDFFGLIVVNDGDIHTMNNGVPDFSSQGNSNGDDDASRIAKTVAVVSDCESNGS